MLAALLTVCVPSFAPQDPPVAGTPRALETYSLQLLRGQRLDELPPPYGTLLLQQDSAVSLLPRYEGGHAFEVDHAVELVQALHRAAADAGELQAQRAGDNLMVFAPPDLLVALRQELAAFEAILARPIAVDAAVYEWSRDEAPPAVATADELTAALQGQEPLWRGCARTRSGVSTAVEQQRWTRYVRSIQVEVAQKSTISGPVVSAFFEGLRVTVEPHALVGTQELALYCQFALGQRRGPVRLVPTGVAGQAALDVPLLELAYGACSGRVPAGGALLVTLGGQQAGGGRLLLAITPRSPQPVVNPTVGKVSVLPISALTSNALQARMPPPSVQHAQQNNDEPFHAGDPLESGEPGFGHVDELTLIELLRPTLGKAGEDGTARLHEAGGFLFVEGAPELRQQLEQALRKLQDRWLANTEVRATALLRELEQADTFARPKAGAPSSNLHLLVLPTLMGRSCVLCRGLETTAVRCWQPEVADSISAANPLVEILQSGLWLQARTGPGQNGPDLDAVLQLSTQIEPSRKSLESGGHLSMTDTGSVRCHLAGEVINGKDLSFGDGPLQQQDGRAFRTALLVRALRR